MEEVVSFVVTAVNSLGVLVPLIPYIFTVFVVYLVMKKLIKPLIRHHQTGGGAFTSKWWMLADKFMWAYSVALGALCYLVVCLTLPGFEGAILHFMFAGLVSSYVATSAQHYLKERGVSIPSDC